MASLRSLPPGTDMALRDGDRPAHEVVGVKLVHVGDPDDEVGLAVAVHVAAEADLVRADAVAEFARLAAELGVADEGEGIVPNGADVGVDPRQVDDVLAPAEVEDLVLADVEGLEE